VGIGWLYAASQYDTACAHLPRAGGATICLTNRVPGRAAPHGIVEMTFDKVIEKNLLVYESSGKV